jgi:hypothetical protein
MKHIKNFLLCLVLLAVAGILHHQWLQMSGGSTGLVSQAEAANLSNGNGQSCSGTGSWHFVNPQSNGDCENLTVVFNCGGSLVTKTAVPKTNGCLNNTTNYANISTSGSCTLVTAFNNAPGKIVLSDLTCGFATPTPTPTPTPTATPTP